MKTAQVLLRTVATSDLAKQLALSTVNGVNRIVFSADELRGLKMFLALHPEIRGNGPGES